MSNRIDPITEQKRMMYINSLLNETLPSAMLTPELMTEMSIDPTDIFGLVHILFNNQLKDTIEAKDATYVADWKASVHQHMLEVFDATTIHTSCVLNLAPYTRTIVYSFSPDDLPKLKDHIRHWFEQTNTFMRKEASGQMMAFANPQMISFRDIGKLYKELRRLQHYQYTIGMGTMTFYDDFHFNDDYSVAEYKFIQRYEQLLNDDRYIYLIPLVNELSTYIFTHVIKDSKVIYIYKELMSITIRHLYSHETDHLKLIDALNHTINNFSNIFNDLNEVSNYIQSLISTLQAAASEGPSYHPHIKRLLHAIETGYNSDLTLDGIADQLNLSNAHLSRLFKEEIGVNFKQYLTKYRIDQIKMLLDTTDKNIQDIATLSGYQSANQMTRIFKKYEQMTPKNYRIRQHS